MIRILLASAALVFATTMAQTADMTFYQLPPGSFPHDVAPAQDGTVWFSGQSQGFAGRFDPKTGQLEKIPLGSGAAPHGVALTPDGTSAYVSDSDDKAVSQYSRSTSTGQLTAIAPGRRSAGVSPYGLAVSADGRNLYVANEGSGSVSQYRVARRRAKHGHR